MMGITIFFAASISKSVSIPGYKRNHFNFNRHNSFFNQFPIFAIGFVMIIKIDGIGFIDLTAGFNAQVVD